MTPKKPSYKWTHTLLLPQSSKNLQRRSFGTLQNNTLYMISFFMCLILTLCSPSGNSEVSKALSIMPLVDSRKGACYFVAVIFFTVYGVCPCSIWLYPLREVQNLLSQESFFWVRCSNDIQRLDLIHGDQGMNS